MADVTVAEEEYLQVLFWLQEAGLPMTGANVARAMQLAPPTVHEMIGRLERDGYITRAGDKSISFTDSGQKHGELVVRAGGRSLSVDGTVAETVSVVADPSPAPRVALPEQLVISRDRYGR